MRLIVGFAAGGPTDVVARAFADYAGRTLGQPFVVDNKPGGGGTIGARIVSEAKPDGYTLLYTTPGPQLTNPFLMKSLP